MANVVLLMSDEHNPFVSSVHGHEKVLTPNLDRLARNGTVFENAYCPSPLCLPARSAFMAGKYVHELRAYSNCNTALPKDFPSWGAVMREQGVHTAYIGKVDVYDDGANLGFSEMIDPWDRGTQGDAFIRRRPLFVRPGAEKRADGYGAQDLPDAAARDNRWVDQALAWLRERAPGIDTPWVLAVNIVNPHFPHYVTKALWDFYRNAGDLPLVGGDAETAHHPYCADLRAHFKTMEFNEEQTRGLRRGYLGCVTYVDSQIGRLLDALEDAGLADDTVFVYTSDHGEMLGKFGMWWKCSLLEDSARVPAMAVGPGFEPERRVKTPVSLFDIQAAMFDAVGASRPDDWIGAPLQSIPDDDRERAVFAEYHGHGTRAGAYMIRKGDWKLIWNADAPHQLFNLVVDPDELLNLYDQHREKADELEKELRAVCSPEDEDQRAFEFQDMQLREMGLEPNESRG